MLSKMAMRGVRSFASVWLRPRAQSSGAFYQKGRVKQTGTVWANRSALETILRFMWWVFRADRFVLVFEPPEMWAFIVTRAGAQQLLSLVQEKKRKPSRTRIWRTVIADRPP